MSVREERNVYRLVYEMARRLSWKLRWEMLAIVVLVMSMVAGGSGDSGSGSSGGVGGAFGERTKIWATLTIYGWFVYSSLAYVHLLLLLFLFVLRSSFSSFSSSSSSLSSSSSFSSHYSQNVCMHETGTRDQIDSPFAVHAHFVNDFLVPRRSERSNRSCMETTCPDLRRSMVIPFSRWMHRRGALLFSRILARDWKKRV